MQGNKPSKETLDQWHRDPNNWKWGLFYFNKQDKRLLPPKKLAALGWTVNFANPLSILILITFFVIVFLISKLSNNTAK